MRITPALAASLGFLGLLAPAHAASQLAFFNSADSDKAYPIQQSGPTLIASVKMQVTEPSNVLVQFSSGATAEKAVDCPCSIRAFLRVDGGALQPVKRINLGSPAVVDVDKYEHDRQSIGGSLVFPVEAGAHAFDLVIQQVDGKSKELEIYYPNMQAISFPK